MLDRSAIINHFHDSLRRGTRYEEPFLLQTFSPFTPELYQEILERLPSDDAYLEHTFYPGTVTEDGKGTRLIFSLDPTTICQSLSGEIRDFWLEFVSILLDSKIRDSFKAILEPELHRRFGSPLPEIAAFPSAMLVRDTSQYKLYIHHDGFNKVITTQYYLPSDGSQKHLGTNIHRRSDDGSFELVRKLDFARGASYCFAVSDRSWHSVDPLVHSEKPRDSLMLVYFNTPGINLV